ncbi:restriction endonuclease [Sphingomonas sp. SUN039]|uniref:restriction endonuclease n=1 Tax=Sphingomonas sp. SUN039 TaxID=2937787 RepID=UPI0021642AA2|nr:restriction endonuclease [Sphingomonas sp. SUN039]UVO55840.1 restriction endonuclease [Sphingomonas sp. SUN039]
MVELQHTDDYLAGKIFDLQQAIQTWAQSHQLWYDSLFKTFAEHVDAEPGSPAVVTILISDGDLLRVVEDDAELYEQFDQLVRNHGFWHESYNAHTVHIYAEEDGPLAVAYDSYFRWQWICGLLEPDFGDVYEELYSHFAGRPEDLHRLSWREYEKLLARIFQAQGFETELGPGSGDGGVDIRLLQRDPLGDLLTLVQAKKYAPNRKIGLEAVAALHGVANVEGADRTLFVTTSAYLPVAHNFAGRTSGSMQLSVTHDVITWCKQASDGIIADKSILVSPQHLERMLHEIGGRKDPRIVHARWGYNVTINDFALVLKETKYAALLMSLPKFTVSDDGYGQIGTEVPVMDQTALPMLTAQCVWRVRRKQNEGRVHYWDGRRLFTPWDGMPQDFNWVD